jgi:chromosome partitioning protein
MVVALMSIKGGVGKTTAAVNLAFLAAQNNARVLLWDLDPQGAAGYLLRTDSASDNAFPPVDATTDVSITDYECLDLLRAAQEPGATERLEPGAITRGLARLVPWYDVVIFDCAAGLDAAAREVAALVDAVLVPVLPSPLGVRTLEQLDRFIARSAHEPAIMPFFSLVDRRRRLHRDTVEQLQIERVSTLSAQIVSSAVVERMGSRRQPVAAFAPQSGVAEAYRALWAEIWGRLVAINV